MIPPSDPSPPTASAASHAPPAPPAHRVPAWALSCLVHVLLLVLLGLLWRTAPHGLSESPEREVSLVLATTSRDSGETAYLDEGESAEREANVTETPAAASEALPAAADASQLVLPDLALPGPEALPGVASEGVVQTAELGGGGQRPRFPGTIDQAAIERERARLRGRGPSGPPAEVSIFGSAPAVGHSFLFVIDRSQSMGGSGLGVLAEAEKELTRALAGLQPVHKFQIIAYHHKPTYFSDQGLIPASVENRRRVAKFFGGLAAFGATRHDVALLAALRAEPDVIFLLTDGGDPAPNQVTLHRIRQRAGGKTTIHCLQFGFGALQEGDNFMQRLAGDTGGQYRYIRVGDR